MPKKKKKAEVEVSLVGYFGYAALALGVLVAVPSLCLSSKGLSDVLESITEVNFYGRTPCAIGLAAIGLDISVIRAHKELYKKLFPSDPEEQKELQPEIHHHDEVDSTSII